MEQFDVGDGVQLRGQPRYLKTADAMPMLRPPDLVDPDEVGEVTAIKAGNQVAVRFRRGTFLFDLNQLLSISDQGGGVARPAGLPSGPRLGHTG